MRIARTRHVVPYNIHLLRFSDEMRASLRFSSRYREARVGSDDPKLFRLLSTRFKKRLLFNPGGRRVVVMPDRRSFEGWLVLAMTRVLDELEVQRGNLLLRIR